MGAEFQTACGVCVGAFPFPGTGRSQGARGCELASRGKVTGTLRVESKFLSLGWLRPQRGIAVGGCGEGVDVCSSWADAGLSVPAPSAWPRPTDPELRCLLAFHPVTPSPSE